jgi:tetratricopeptide (TPR) repeat protein
MTDNQNLFDQAVAAAKQKDFATARTLLKQLLKQDPNNLDAWLLGAYVVESRSDAIRCYERVLQIDPNHIYARQKLSELQALPPETPPVKPASQPAASQPKAPRAQSASHPSAAPVNPPESKSKSSTWMFVLAGVLIIMCCLTVGGIGIVSSGGLPSLGSSQPTPTDQQLFDVLHTNAKAGVNEDLEAYMATIHPNSPLNNRTEDTLKEMFATYDLNFEFYDLTVTSLMSNEAKIHFSLLTRKRAGPDFRNNIVIGMMILRPDDGVWKIYNQTVEDVQY